MYGETKHEYRYDANVDTYCYPGTPVLINKFNIREQSRLIVAERQITALKIAEIERNPIDGCFDLKHLRDIHCFIFSDIYEWAGEIRGGDFLMKADSIFCRAMHIESYATGMYAKLRKEDFLTGLPKQDFIEKLAYFMGEVNVLHPFREGNGRTARLYFKQLCKNAHYDLEFRKTQKELLLHADISAFNCDYEPLMRILNEIVTAL